MLMLQVEGAYQEGRLADEGIVGGGRSGKSEAFNDKSIRSDTLGYFDGTQAEGWARDSALPQALAKMVSAS
jgi:hypothetical protein